MAYEEQERIMADVKEKEKLKEITEREQKDKQRKIRQSDMIKHNTNVFFDVNSQNYKNPILQNVYQPERKIFIGKDYIQKYSEDFDEIGSENKKLSIKYG